MIHPKDGGQVGECGMGVTNVGRFAESTSNTCPSPQRRRSRNQSNNFKGQEYDRTKSYQPCQGYEQIVAEFQRFFSINN